MAKRVRLLIYEASPERLVQQRLHEYVKGDRIYNDLRITSIDLDPTRMTLRELLRLFWTETAQRAKDGTLWPQ